MWDRLEDGSWISDAYVDQPLDPVAPPCDDPGGEGSPPGQLPPPSGLPEGGGGPGDGKDGSFDFGAGIPEDG